MTQLSLLDLKGTDTNLYAEIQWLPVDNLQPHPDNPRLIYREDIIDTIARSITESGFNPCYALLVRPLGTQYQIISGHTRHKAAIKAGCNSLPCWVKEIDDDAAFMELVLANNQGELSPLEYGIHVLKYVEVSEGGRGKKGGLSEYAKTIGKHDNTLRPYRDAAIVINAINLTDIRDVLDKANHIAAIHKSPEQYWQQLTELLIEKEWSVKQTETIVSAIKDVDIPQVLHGFLNPEYWVKKVITDATSETPQKLQDKVKMWVSTAIEDLKSLSTEQGVWQFDENEQPYFEIVNLQSRFIDRLPELVNGDQVPSAKKINALRQSLTDWVKKSNDRYEKWQKAQASKDELERQKREELERVNALKVKYAPTGINADIRDLELSDIGGVEFNAIITDPPYLLSNGGFTLRSGKETSVNKNFDDTEGSAISPEEWMPKVEKFLSPGGVIIATCTLHIYHRLIKVAQEIGLETEREQAIWLKPNSPPQLSPTLLRPDFEYIFIAFKAGDHYFGYDEYKKRWDEQPSRTFIIPQCGGSERLGWHDTQKPLELMQKLITLYVPSDGLVLDPFSGSGTTAVAAKSLGRIAYWVEKDIAHYGRSEHRIEQHPFHWE
jgi:site-specific DNA-methyltransferase (adenine-specific)